MGLGRSRGWLAAVGLLTFVLVVLFVPSAALGGSTITVTNTNDSGAGSLRQAILDANAADPPSTINFNIPTSDDGFNGQWFVIQPLTELPELTAGGTTVNGSTQTGNTNATGPAIEIDGNLSVPTTGLTIDASYVSITDLSIDRFTGSPSGIQVSGMGSQVTDCYLGADPSGADVGNANNDMTLDADGVRVTGNLIVGGTVGIGDFSGNYAVIQGNRIEDNRLIGVDMHANGGTIGGALEGDGNLISGNTMGGIGIEGSNATVEGNLIGTDATGLAAEGNGGSGISVIGLGATIGGTAAGARNVISGNADSGIDLNEGADSTVIEGNYIGVDANGGGAVGNDAFGVNVVDASDTVIGGTSAAARNVISGNGVTSDGPGIAINGSTGTVVQGNYVGTDATGRRALGNGGPGVTICCGTTGTVIGGAAAGAGNVLSANRVGVDLPGPSNEASGTTIQGNLIGTDATGTRALGNRAAGIGSYKAVSLLIGGDAPGDGNLVSGNMVGMNLGVDSGVAVRKNVVRANRFDGIQIESLAAGAVVESNTIAQNGSDGIDLFSGTGNTFTRNSIFSNKNLGIDLNGDGVTPNDAGDGDTGPNNLQNYPVLMSASEIPSHLIVIGRISTSQPQTATVELFGTTLPSPGANPLGYGEGAMYLGSVTPAPSGFFVAFLPKTHANLVISATATDADGNTSEFARDIVTLGSTGATPAITGFTPAIGTAGTHVTITGSGFTDTTSVSFGGTLASSYTVVSDTTIAAVVAHGTTKGPITVVTAEGQAKSAGSFTPFAAG